LGEAVMNFVLRILLEQVAFTILKGVVKATVNNKEAPKEVNLDAAIDVFMGRKPAPKDPLDRAIDVFMGRTEKPKSPPEPSNQEFQIPPVEQELGDLITQFMDRCKRADKYPGQTFDHEEAFSSLRVNLVRLKPYMGGRVFVVQNLINFIDKALETGRGCLAFHAHEFITMVMGG
jgi:hypothetical protein